MKRRGLFFSQQEELSEIVKKTLKQQNKSRMTGIMILDLWLSFILLFNLVTGNLTVKLIAGVGIVFAVMTVIICRRCILEFNRVIDLRRPTEEDENAVNKSSSRAFFYFFLETICLLASASIQ